MSTVHAALNESPQQLIKPESGLGDLTISPKQLVNWNPDINSQVDTEL